MSSVSIQPEQVLDGNARPSAECRLEAEISLEFLAELDVDTHRLADAIAAADLGGVSHSAHRIKGAARMLGADTLGAIAELMEFFANGGDVRGTRLARDAFADAVHHFRSRIAATGAASTGVMS